MAETDLRDWLTASDAAAQIGCSTRTIERLAAAKQLEQRLRPQKGSPDVAVFSPESVAEVAQARRREAPPFVVGAVQPSTNGNGHAATRQAVARTVSAFTNVDEARAAMVSVVTDLARAVSASLSPPSPPVAEKVAETPLLTLDETAAFLRVTGPRVRALIRAGILMPVKLSGRAVDWRIRRKDLEAL